MSELEIYQNLRGLIQDHFQLSPDNFSPSLNFKLLLERLRIDIVESFLELLERFGSLIPDDERLNINSVQLRAYYIKAHQK